MEAKLGKREVGPETYTPLEPQAPQKGTRFG